MKKMTKYFFVDLLAGEIEMFGTKKDLVDAVKEFYGDCLSEHLSACASIKSIDMIDEEIEEFSKQYREDIRAWCVIFSDAGDEFEPVEVSLTAIQKEERKFAIERFKEKTVTLPESEYVRLKNLERQVGDLQTRVSN